MARAINAIAGADRTRATEPTTRSWARFQNARVSSRGAPDSCASGVRAILARVAPCGVSAPETSKSRNKEISLGRTRSRSMIWLTRPWALAGTVTTMRST